MNFTIIVLGVLAVLAIVALIAMTSRNSAERSKAEDERKKAEEALQNKILGLSTENAALRSQVEAGEEAKAQLVASHENALKLQKEAQEQAMTLQKEAQEKALAVQKEQHEKELESMKDAFKALSAENSASFKSQSSETIAEILKPIHEKFSEFDKAIRETQKESAAQSAAMKENIESVMKHSQAVGDEARNLANALTGYSKVQGDFGEMLLTDVLKNAGLVEGIHFVTQGVILDESGREIKSEEGRTMIPDVMVFYPDETTVIVDSKVSLNSYKEYINAESIEDRKRLAKAHVESVRKHVDELKNKDYTSYIPKERRKVNYNIMFIPVEGAFRLMLEEDPLLWQVAKDNNVLIVSQMTLVIVLNMIQMAWKQANQEKNIEDVYKTAEELMSQLNGWMDSYVRIGDALDKAKSAYSDSTKKLQESNQSVVKKIQKLEKLGLTPKRSQANIKTGSRTSAIGSIIPQKLSTDLPVEEE